MEGLADGSAPGNPPRVTEEAKEFLKERLSEQRTWNAPQLAEALLGRFGISASAEAIRQHLIAMCYSWKRILAPFLRFTRSLRHSTVTRSAAVRKYISSPTGPGYPSLRCPGPQLRRKEVVDHE